MTNNVLRYYNTGTVTTVKDLENEIWAVLFSHLQQCHNVDGHPAMMPRRTFWPPRVFAKRRNTHYPPIVSNWMGVVKLTNTGIDFMFPVFDMTKNGQFHRIINTECNPSVTPNISDKFKMYLYTSVIVHVSSAETLYYRAILKSHTIHANFIITPDHVILTRRRCLFDK